MSMLSNPNREDTELHATSLNEVRKPSALRVRQQIESGHYQRLHYTARDIDKFNSLNMIQLLAWYDEASLIYDDKTLTLKEHPTCIVFAEGVYNTENCRLYQVIDALINLLGFRFPHACFIANSFLKDISFSMIRAYCEHKYPQASKVSLDNNFNFNDLLAQNLFEHGNSQSIRTAYALLHNRYGIERPVVTEFMYRKYLLMDTNRNLCFVTYSQGNVIAVVRKMHEKNYNTDEYQSTKRNVGFQYASEQDANYDMYRSVYVFENIIELMSYLSLARMGKVPTIEKASCLIALNGLKNGVLYNFLSEHHEVKTIYGCLGNDDPAINAARFIRQRQYVDMQPFLRDYSLEHGYVKNWNALLKQIQNEYAAKHISNKNCI